MSTHSHLKDLKAMLSAQRAVPIRKHASTRGAVMVEAAVAAPLLIGLLLVTVWFSTLYTAKIDSVVSARAKTMAYASSGCKAPVTDGTAPVEPPTMAEWNSNTNAVIGQAAQDAIAAATVHDIAGCSKEAKKYNVAMVTVSKASTMPIGNNQNGSGFLGKKTFTSTSYALCNPTSQTTSGLATMGASIGTLLGQIMGSNPD